MRLLGALLPAIVLALAGPQPLTAELSDASAHELGLTPGASVVATWKAAATRLLRL